MVNIMLTMDRHPATADLNVCNSDADDPADGNDEANNFYHFHIHVTGTES